MHHKFNYNFASQKKKSYLLQFLLSQCGLEKNESRSWFIFAKEMHESESVSRRASFECLFAPWESGGEKKKVYRIL